MKTQYRISETAHVRDVREHKVIEAESIKQAQIQAKKMQRFQTTCMKICDVKGNLICFRNGNGDWKYEVIKGTFKNRRRN